MPEDEPHEIKVVTHVSLEETSEDIAWRQAQKEAVIIDSPDCLEPSVLDALTKVTYAESQALLKVNEKGVEQFFARKGCPDIGKVLRENGIVGSTLPMLTMANIERDLKLTIGKQLAFKTFLKRMSYVERGNRRRDQIFVENEFAKRKTPVHAAGCCPGWCSWLQVLCFCHKEEEKEEIEVWEPSPAKYVLNTDSLKLVASEWADGTPVDTDRVIKYKPNCACADSLGCGFCCGYKREGRPQIVVRTNNIDLKSLLDVDNSVLSTHTVKHHPDCYEQCWGWHNTEITYPAHVLVTYADGGEINVCDNSDRKQVTLKVDPLRAEEISQALVAGMEDAHREVREAAGARAGANYSPGSVADNRSFTENTCQIENTSEI